MREKERERDKATEEGSNHLKGLRVSVRLTHCPAAKTSARVSSSRVRTDERWSKFLHWSQGVEIRNRVWKDSTVLQCERPAASPHTRWQPIAEQPRTVERSADSVAVIVYSLFFCPFLGPGKEDEFTQQSFLSVSVSILTKQKQPPLQLNDAIGTCYGHQVVNWSKFALADCSATLGQHKKKKLQTQHVTVTL